MTARSDATRAGRGAVATLRAALAPLGSPGALSLRVGLIIFPLGIAATLVGEMAHYGGDPVPWAAAAALGQVALLACLLVARRLLCRSGDPDPLAVLGVFAVVGVVRSLVFAVAAVQLGALDTIDLAYRVAGFLFNGTFLAFIAWAVALHDRHRALVAAAGACPPAPRGPRADARRGARPRRGGALRRGPGVDRARPPCARCGPLGGHDGDRGPCGPRGRGAPHRRGDPPAQPPARGRGARGGRDRRSDGPAADGTGPAPAGDAACGRLPTGARGDRLRGRGDPVGDPGLRAGRAPRVPPRHLALLLGSARGRPAPRGGEDRPGGPRGGRGGRGARGRRRPRTPRASGSRPPLPPGHLAARRRAHGRLRRDDRRALPPRHGAPGAHGGGPACGQRPAGGSRGDDPPPPLRRPPAAGLRPSRIAPGRAPRGRDPPRHGRRPGCRACRLHPGRHRRGLCAARGGPAAGRGAADPRRARRDGRCLGRGPDAEHHRGARCGGRAHGRPGCGPRHRRGDPRGREQRDPPRRRAEPAPVGRRRSRSSSGTTGRGSAIPAGRGSGPGSSTSCAPGGGTWTLAAGPSSRRRSRAADGRAGDGRGERGDRGPEGRRAPGHAARGASRVCREPRRLADCRERCPVRAVERRVCPWAGSDGSPR